MDRKLCSCLLAATVGVSFAGCGSGTATPPPLVVPDGGADRPRDLPRFDAGGGAPVPPAPPMPAAGAMRLIEGPAFLLLDGPACTSQEGATGDRWCGFFAESQTSLGNFDLFVVNVTKAAAGTAIDCRSSTPDRNCLHLTGGAVAGEEAPAAFFGDTLLYHDVTGMAYAWRPGLFDGRPLTAGDGSGLVRNCIPAAAGPTISCLRDVLNDDPSGTQSVDLFVGNLELPADPVLRRLDRVIAASALDSASFPSFRRALSASGAFIAWSSRPSANEPEVLKVQQVANDATRATVATDVSNWQISPDETRWFWLSRFNYGANGDVGRGTLQTARFPAGTGAATMLANVTQYVVSPHGAVATLSDYGQSGGVLRGFVDPAGAPAVSHMLDSGSRGIIKLSRQGHALYVKQFDPLFGISDLHIKKVDGTEACTLDAREQVQPTGVFFPSGKALLWLRLTDFDLFGDVKTETMYTTIATCESRRVASNIASVSAAGDDGIIYVDSADEIAGDLRFRAIGPESMLGTDTPRLIQSRADLGFEAIPSMKVVLYAIVAGSSSDGLYIYNYTTPVTVPGDGGAAD